MKLKAVGWFIILPLANNLTVESSSNYALPKARQIFNDKFAFLKFWFYDFLIKVLLSKFNIFFTKTRLGARFEISKIAVLAMWMGNQKMVKFMYKKLF